MSASFYDLMKYAKTGIAAPSMTHYDKLKALSMCKAGFPVKTLTGVPPLTFQSDGTPLTAWSISGNMTQTGKPTPSAPIQPEECGDRTGNLFDAATAYGSLYHNGVVSGTTLDISRIKNYFTAEQIGKQVTISIFADKVTATRIYVRTNIAGSNIESNSIYIGSTGTMSVTITPQSINDHWIVTYGSGAYNECILSNIMLNTGSTALPYEPYGYKIPLTCGGQTVPVYLGQTQTVRRIKKLVMTGEENWSRHTDTGTLVLAVSGSDAAYLISGEVTCTCTHYPAQNNVSSYSQMVDKKICMRANSSNIWIRDTDYSTTTDFKTYLQQQYAAGTPVTVWYVLAAPETGIVNEPLCKIGDYADELSSTDAAVTIPTAKGQNTLTVDTELQPSEISITGGIK